MYSSSDRQLEDISEAATWSCMKMYISKNKLQKTLEILEI